jgi:fucose permease
LAALFLCIDVGAEICAGGYLYSYGVLKELATKTESAYLTSGFWGALTLGRLLAVPGTFATIQTDQTDANAAAIKMTSAQILFANMSICLLANIVWLLFLDSSVALWIGTIIYGFGISSCFPTAINLTENYMRLSGILPLN